MGEQGKTEILAVCSGRGGTGKSLLCACFGYALLRGGQRVLMIDGDAATHGLSLFLLGPKGQEQITSFEDQNTFTGSLERFQKTGGARFEPRAIPRRGDDHRVTYDAILSGRGLYGDGPSAASTGVELNRGNFRACIRHLFDQLRSSGEYDYVLVDTRGGSSFESTDLCALADSFVLVIEPDDHSLHQNRNLLNRIAAVAHEVDSPSSLRAVIVNKAVDVSPHEGKPALDTFEVPFRERLAQELGVRFEDTYPVPFSPKALLAYKAHKIPYRGTPESLFSMATLAAFTSIVQVANSAWTPDQVDRWNVLIDTVGRAVQEKREFDQQKNQSRAEGEDEAHRLRVTVREQEETIETLGRNAEARLSALHLEYESKLEALQRDLEQRNLLYENEHARAEVLTATIGQFTAPAHHDDAAAAPQTADAHPGAVAAAGEMQPFPLAETGYDSDVTREQNFEQEQASPASPSREAFAAFIGHVNGARNSSSLAGAGLLLLLVIGVVSLLLRHAPKTTVAAMPTAHGQDVPAVVPHKEAPSPVKNEPQNPDQFAVLLAGGKSLNATERGAPSAAYEAQLALRSGFAVQVYQRTGRYTALVPWETRAEAEESMKEVQSPFSGRWAGTSALVTISDWCPEKTALDPLVVSGKEVPVWSCGSALSASSRPGTSER